MGRPRIAPDSHGIVNYCETSPGRFRARVRYRDRDGIVRYVAGFGTSKSAANTALQESLKRRQPVTSSSGISGETPMSVLAEVWLASRFGPLWDHGEYFRAEPELMAYIDEVRATQDTRQPA